MKNGVNGKPFSEHHLFWSWSNEAAKRGTDELREKINLYLIAKIWQNAHSWNEEVVSKLKSPISIFVPHQHNPYTSLPEKFKHGVHDTDLEAICKSHGALLLPPYGNDCAYEVGIYKMMNIAHGKGKIIFPVIAFVRDDISFLRDWMVKGGITHIVTDNLKTLKRLQADPMLGSNKRDIIKINKLDQLHDVVIKIINSVRS